MDVEGNRNKRLEESFNSVLHNLHPSANIGKITKSQRTRWDRYVARMADNKNAYRILMGKLE